MTPPDGIDSSRALWGDLAEFEKARRLKERVVARGQGVPSWPVVVDAPPVETECGERGGQGRGADQVAWYGTLVLWLSWIAVAGGFAAVVWILVAGRK